MPTYGHEIKVGLVAHDQEHLRRVKKNREVEQRRAPTKRGLPVGKRGNNNNHSNKKLFELTNLADLVANWRYKRQSIKTNKE